MSNVNNAQHKQTSRLDALAACSFALSLTHSLAVFVTFSLSHSPRQQQQLLAWGCQSAGTACFRCAPVQLFGQTVVRLYCESLVRSNASRRESPWTIRASKVAQRQFPVVICGERATKAERCCCCFYCTVGQKNDLVEFLVIYSSL